mmetsp:Transcript_96588/g.262388  ORF Transcript_96588/g.262388 Transcript_96588/m.262388 type:complete len:442 (+) Transcript_96588:2418-3743(+)
MAEATASPRSRTRGWASRRREASTASRCSSLSCSRRRWPATSGACSSSAPLKFHIPDVAMSCTSAPSPSASSEPWPTVVRPSATRSTTSALSKRSRAGHTSIGPYLHVAGECSTLVLSAGCPMTITGAGVGGAWTSVCSGGCPTSMDLSSSLLPVLPRSCLASRVSSSATICPAARSASRPAVPNFSGQNRAFMKSNLLSMGASNSHVSSLGPAFPISEVAQLGTASSLPNMRVHSLIASMRARPSSSTPPRMLNDFLARSTVVAGWVSSANSLAFPRIVFTLSGSRVMSHWWSEPHRVRREAGTSSFFSCISDASFGLNCVSIASRRSALSALGLSRIALATSRPRLCTWRFATSFIAAITESFCSSLSCIISSSPATSGACACSSRLMFLKLVTTMLWTKRSSAGVSNPVPRSMRLSSTTCKTSPFTNKSMAGQTGTSP